jgi:hypothetical protein
MRVRLGAPRVRIRLGASVRPVRWGALRVGWLLFAGGVARGLVDRSRRLAGLHGSGIRSGGCGACRRARGARVRGTGGRHRAARLSRIRGVRWAAAGAVIPRCGELRIGRLRLARTRAARIRLGAGRRLARDGAEGHRRHGNRGKRAPHVATLDFLSKPRPPPDKPVTHLSPRAWRPNLGPASGAAPGCNPAVIRS